MAGLFAFIFLVALIALPISLIKPQIFSRFFNATRTKNSLLLGGIIFVSFIMLGLTAPQPKNSPSETNTSIPGTSQKDQISTTPAKVDAPTLTLAPTATPTPTDTPTPTEKVYPTATPRPIIYPTSTPAPAVNTATQTSGGWACNCSKTCTQISSCAEAQYLLHTCGCSARDADHDGIACDSAPLHCQN